MRLLADELAALCRRSGQRAAIVDGGATLSYEQVWRWSDRIAHQLGRAGVVAGRRVALVLPNSAAFVAAFFGASRTGAVVAPLHPGSRSQELVRYLTDMQPGAVVVDDATLGAVLQALGRLGATPSVLLVGSVDACELIVRGAVPNGTDPMAADPPALLLYTSGSSGPPKRAVRTHTRLLAELNALRSLFGVTCEDRLLGAAPFSHVNGLVRTMLTAMFAGARLYPLRQFSPAVALRLLARDRLTFLGGVPHMYALLAAPARREAADLSSLRIAFSSSAPLLPDDNRAFQRAYGIFVRQLYGSTETGTIAYNGGSDPEMRLESVGQALEGVETAVLDEDGASLESGAEGEIAVSSRFAITGYDGDPAATRAHFRAGRYLTGDLGYVDSDGYLTLTGRKGLMINRGGYKVNPYEVEEAILQHPKVAEVVVLGAPAPHGDQVVRCLVVSRGSCTAGEIVGHCRERLADFKIPSRIEFRDSLPRTPTGKIRRAEL